MNEDSKLLAWFLGPKAENASLLEEMLLLVLRDYCHWRRNYFPSVSHVQPEANPFLNSSF